MSPEEEQQSSIADDLVRRSALHAFILESPGGTSTETIGIPASCDVSPAQDLDDIHGLLDEINSITIDDAKGIYSPEHGGDQSSYLTGSSWGYVPNITMWNSVGTGAITGFVIDYEDVANLLPPWSDGRLTRGSYSKEEQQGSTGHDFNSMEKTESGATGMLLSLIHI